MAIEMKSVITTLAETQNVAESEEHADWQVIQVNKARMFDDSADPNDIVIFFGKKATEVPTEGAATQSPSEETTETAETAPPSLLEQETAAKGAKNAKEAAI